MEEKGRVQSHYYKNHVALDKAPHYCAACGFRCSTRRQLERHLRGYEPHIQRAKTMNEVDLANCLRESPDPLYLGEQHVRILSVEESAAHWKSRAVTGVKKRRRSTDILDQAVRLSFPSSQGLAEFSAEDVEEYVPTKKVKPSSSVTSCSTSQSDSFFVPDHSETPLDLTLKVRPEPDIILEFADELSLLEPAIQVVPVEGYADDQNSLWTLAEEVVSEDGTASSEATGVRSVGKMEAEVALLSAVEVLTGTTSTMSEHLVTSCVELKNLSGQVSAMKTKFQNMESIERRIGTMENDISSMKATLEKVLDACQRRQVLFQEVIHGEGWEKGIMGFG